MKLEKGMLIAVQGIWYVVVTIEWDAYLFFGCICDHANNVHHWTIEDVQHYLTVKEAVNTGWGWPERDFKGLEMRAMPFDVMMEVIQGKHDDRFPNGST